MRNERDVVTIKRMIDYCDDIDLLLNQYNRDFKRYVEDISFQYSCNMCIIQIGELVGRLSDELLEEYTDIPWHAIKSMRNLHAHDYDNVDLDIVWNTLVEDIPALREQLMKIL